jgi:hypothetical protein
LGKSIPATSRTCVAFVAVRQPPTLSGGGKYSLAWAVVKIIEWKSSGKKVANAQRGADEAMLRQMR